MNRMNTMKDIPNAERPYEKCLKQGAEALSDAELLAVLHMCIRNRNNSVKVQPEKASGERDLDYFMEQMKKRVMSYHQQNSSAEVKGKSDIFKPQVQVDRVKEVAASYRAKQSPEQMTLFDGKLLDKEKRANYKICLLYTSLWGKKIMIRQKRF